MPETDLEHAAVEDIPLEERYRVLKEMIGDQLVWLDTLELGRLYAFNGSFKWMKTKDAAIEAGILDYIESQR